MPPDPNDPLVWLHDARGGCPDSAARLYEKYQRRLLSVLRARMHPLLRPLYDPEDLAQDVWVVLFTRAELPAFGSPAHLASFLELVAARAAWGVNRRHLDSGKRDLHRRLPVDVRAAAGGEEPPSSSPSPVEVAIADDRWAHLLNGRPAWERRLLALRRQGWGWKEAGTILGVAEWLVRRLLGSLVAAG